MYKIQPEDRQVIQEFRRNPIGNHSPRLQRIMNLFRGAPIPLAVLITIAFGGLVGLVGAENFEHEVFDNGSYAYGGAVFAHHTRQGST